ncbi:Fc.00g116070.m01.CDS01 [Cosmosporella sp. VM-42]
MRLQSPLTAVTSALWAVLGLSAVQAQGSLSLVEGDSLFTFEYSTTAPASTNWVGLYLSSGGGPVDEKYVSAALVWKYAPDAQGTVYLPTANLEPGDYTAFFLARDGYKWLTDPVNVVLPSDPDAPVDFITTSVTLPNARQGDKYSQRISGLVKGGGGSVTFSKQSRGSDWLSVSPEGILSGTPSSRTSDTSVSVLVTGSNKSTAMGIFKIPVRPAGSRLLREVRVLTFNMWHGGTQVNNYHEKQVRFLATSGADIVGLQEDQSGRHAPRLAEALGWNYWASGGDTSILSRYPIAEKYGVISKPDRSGGVRVALDGEDQQINFYVTHLGYNPYGPYDFCFDKMTIERVMEREAQSGRTPQITETLAGMEQHLAQADQLPVLLVGDFNAPSHLDWIERLKNKNCGYSGVSWPTSKLPEKKGLIDSFRVANPDPVKNQGLTWSPITPWNDGRNLPEPQDRIDFIYHKGRGLQVLESRRVVVGEPKPMPDYEDNEWTSDHAAMLTTYKIAT